MAKLNSQNLSPAKANADQEWLLTDGTGTFAMGCVDRLPRRKYHSLLAIPDGLTPDGTGKNLVQDLIETLEVGDTRIALATLPTEFTAFPSPTWTLSATLPSGGELKIERQLQALERGSLDIEAGFRIRYRFTSPRRTGRIALRVRPVLLSRPLHALVEKNPVLNGMPSRTSERTWVFRPYPTDPTLVFAWEGQAASFEASGTWQTTEYAWEAERGYDARESVFLPGEFVADVSQVGELSLRMGYTTIPAGTVRLPSANKPRVEIAAERDTGTALRAAALSFAADVHGDGGSNPTLTAGLPWFGPWARDLFISIPGYALAAGKSDLPYLMMATGGRRLLSALSGQGASGQTLGQTSGMNAHGADSPWLYLWALEQLIEQDALKPMQQRVLLELGAELASAVLAQKGPVHAEPQGGLRIDAGPWALSWMDAMIGGTPVTPRHGYPVEINALFISGLGFLVDELPEHRARGRFAECYEASRTRFPKLFASTDRPWLADCGGADATPADYALRPNSLWALALPRVPVPEAIAKRTLAAIREQLLTPAGLRTLAPRDPAYRAQCVGDQRRRDEAYHQGTVWPWLVGVYADAVRRWESATVVTQDLKPVREWLNRHLFAEGCIGQVSEILDGETPHHPRGAPAQAWSACELFRAFEEFRR